MFRYISSSPDDSMASRVDGQTRLHAIIMTASISEAVESNSVIPTSGGSLESSSESVTTSIIEDPVETEFQAPSMPPNQQDTYTFLSKIPENIIDTSSPCILGVDEAGRGPVIGPMVYAVSYCRKDFESDLKQFQFADSKVLTAEQRTDLMKALCEEEALKHNIGWATTVMSAQDISSGMLRPNSHGNYNLNEQAHDTTIELIQQVVKLGVNVAELYVDTVGPPQSYQAKLSRVFPGMKVTVAKKADSIYPIVSAASICAKVTRDQCVHGESWGSGYPSDPNTVRWLEQQVDKVFGWNHMIRYSWQTTKDIMARKGCVDMESADEILEKNAKISAFFNDSKPDPHFVKADPNSLSHLPISTRCFGYSWQG